MDPKTDHIPTHMPTSNRPRNLGASLDDDASRLDAVAKVTGRAKYGRDMVLPNMLLVGFIRCPYGSADLVSIDLEAARNVQGVVEVEQTRDTANYHGRDIGYIVAESKLALMRARTALNAKWNRKPVKTRITDSELDEQELDGDAATGLADAKHKLEAVYETPSQTHSSFETHGVTVDHDGESATVYASTQGTSSVAGGIGEHLGLPQSKYQVICEYVGGGFGSKFGPGKEGVTAAKIAAKYKRPVWCFVDRAEEHLDTGMRPSSRSKVRIGFNENGVVEGGGIQTWGGVGSTSRGGGCSFPSRRFNYQNNNVKSGRTTNVSFNGGGPKAMRAPGHPQGAFAEELMLDEIATIAGVDPIDLRRQIDTSEARREMYVLGAEIIGWSQRKKTGGQTGVMRRGFGVGTCNWGMFGGRGTFAEVAIHRDGSVEPRTGTQDIGTGQRTIMGILAAENIGVPLEYISVRIGDSRLPNGPASGGSVTAHSTAPAMISAALDAKAQFLDALADKIGADAGELTIENGHIVRGGERILSWTDACRQMNDDAIVGRGERGREHVGEGHSDGVQFAEVEVDSETGVIRVKRVVAIQSCGRVICRKTAESQIIGAVIQGVSYALFENKLLDRKVGAMVNANLEFYKILGTKDMPQIEPVLWTKGQTGVRSLGEPPVVPTAGAVACAVFNAIGSPVRSLPLTPDKVLAAIEAGEGGVA